MSDPRLVVPGAAFAVGSTTLAAVGAALVEPVLMVIAIAIGILALGTMGAGLRGVRATRRLTAGPARVRDSSHPPVAHV